MSKLIFEKDNEGYLDQYHYDLSKNESGNYTSNDTQVLYYGYRQALRRITKLKAENEHLTEIFDEAMKSASEYSESLCKANKKNEMMRNVLTVYSKMPAIHTLACQVLCAIKTIDDN